MVVAKTETRDALSDKLPADFAEQSQRIVNNAFRLLAEQTQQLANDIAEFNQRRSDTKERIRRGARRTTRRVI